MAQRVEVLLEDDIDGSEAAGTVEFALDGVRYEIDLSEEHVEELRETLEPWLTSARRVGGRRARLRSGAALSAAQASVGTNESADVRAWATANGFEVSARGRIPSEVREAYEAARA